MISYPSALLLSIAGLRSDKPRTLAIVVSIVSAGVIVLGLLAGLPLC